MKILSGPRCAPAPAWSYSRGIHLISFQAHTLFSATHCGGENHSITLPCMESEILLGFEPNDFFGCPLALMLGETASGDLHFPGAALSACRHPD